MGRVKAQYPQGKFVFRNKKPNAKGELMLYLQYVVNTIPVVKTTGFSFKPDDWDPGTQRVKSKHANAARFNNLLKNMRDAVDAQILDYEGRLVPELVKDMMYGRHKPKGNAKTIDFIQYALDHNKMRYDNEKLAYSTWYNGMLNIGHFKQYIVDTTGESIIYINDLTVNVIEEFKAIYLKRGNNKEGINKKLTPLIKAAQYAADNDLLSQRVAAAIAASYFVLKKNRYDSEIEDEDIKYLTLEQLQEFMSLYDTVKHDRTREIMDLFMFAFYACGLRVSDIITLEWKHVDFEAKEIAKNLVKGKGLHKIPLITAAMEILQRWKNKGRNTRFVFDLMQETFDINNAAALDMKIKSVNRNLQQSLRAVGEKFQEQLPFNLTMHVARHSWAVMALNVQKMDLLIISKLLGHSSITVTEKVYAKFLQETITEEVKSKLEFDFSSKKRQS